MIIIIHSISYLVTFLMLSTYLLLRILAGYLDLGITWQASYVNKLPKLPFFRVILSFASL
jgi:hypothetical protein